MSFTFKKILSTGFSCIELFKISQRSNEHLICNIKAIKKILADQRGKLQLIYSLKVLRLLSKAVLRENFLKTLFCLKSFSLHALSANFSVTVKLLHCRNGDVCLT